MVKNCNFIHIENLQHNKICNLYSFTLILKCYLFEIDAYGILINIMFLLQVWLKQCIISYQEYIVSLNQWNE